MVCPVLSKKYYSSKNNICKDEKTVIVKEVLV